MSTHPAAEPTTLAEMNARKKLADQRQAEAARRLRDGRSATKTAAPTPVVEPPPPAALAPPAAPFDPATAAARAIIAHVAAQYDLTAADLVGESRIGIVVAARREAMGEVHKAKPHLSYPQLGRIFGDRDHTTVLHALRELGLKPEPETPASGFNRVDDRGIRAIRPLDLQGLEPAALGAAVPRVQEVDPCDLLIDAGYQRDLSKQSLALIRRIVGEWSWRAFKPPIVVEAEGKLHVIDGQHTAIAAASHPGIDRIPVMIVEAERHQDRADAFVRHNRDRVRMSGHQIYHALVAAGDAHALAIDLACRETGARILRSKPTAIRYRPGDTMAVEALSLILKRRGTGDLRRVLSACVLAQLAPIRSHELKAVEALLFDPDHAGEFDEAAIAALLVSLGASADRQAGVFAAQHRVPRARGLAITLARAPKRLRKSGGGEP